MTKNFLDPGDPRCVEILRRLIGLALTFSEGKFFINQLDTIEYLLTAIEEIKKGNEAIQIPRNEKKEKDTDYKLANKQISKLLPKKIEAVINMDPVKKNEVLFSSKSPAQKENYDCEIESRLSFKENPCCIMRSFIKKLMLEKISFEHSNLDEDLKEGILGVKRILEKTTSKLKKIILVEKEGIIPIKNEETVFKKTYMAGSDCFIFVWTKNDRILYWSFPAKTPLGDLMSFEGIETNQLKSLIMVRPPSSDIATIEFIRFG